FPPLSFIQPAPPVLSPLSLHDALPIYLLGTLRARYPGQYRFHTTLDAHLQRQASEEVAQHAGLLLRTGIGNAAAVIVDNRSFERSEEHTSELQSRENLVCRLLLEKKKK